MSTIDHAFVDPLWGAENASDPCLKCGQPERKHRGGAGSAARSKKSAKRSPDAKARRLFADRGRVRGGGREREARKLEKTIIGVDGEGIDTPPGPNGEPSRHIYTYLAAVDEYGECVAEAYNENGLSHDECAEMLLSISPDALKFGFMFSYDVTKIIEDMPNADKFYLMRPGARQARECKTCKHKWSGPAKLCPECGSQFARGFTRKLTWKGRGYDFFNGSLTISKKVAEADIERGDRKKGESDGCKIWDCFRFFGVAFVEAIKDWGVATKEQIERIAKMKALRGSQEFAEDPEAVRAYCREECHLLALMMRKVITAHDDAGISLKRYEGAGSTASALLGKNKVGEHKGPNLSELAMFHPAAPYKGASGVTAGTTIAFAIACAFFGGRFENSCIGKIESCVHGYDVSSAYPYAMSDLPCLKCGVWKHVTGSAKKLRKAVDRAALAVCKFRVGELTPAARRKMAWGPLPFRDEKGSIAYGANFEGWAWKPELIPALHWPHVELCEEAWVYKPGCDDLPFGFVPGTYVQRLLWGKDGAGKALKLGINAGYGKCAQTLGDDPPYQSWIWAGNITATCRGQILTAILKAKDPWSVLAIATDGIYSVEALDLPKPRETGTGTTPNTKGEFKPLGGWEHKEIPEGAFLAKPGLYFRLGSVAEPVKLDDIRARGVGRREVFEQRAALMQAFADWDRLDFKHHVTMTSRRFYGAKSSVVAQSGCEVCGTKWPGVPEQGCPKCKAVGTTFKTHGMKTVDGQEAYGTWNLRHVDVRFDPHPKRERVLKQGGPNVRLRMRDLGGRKSAPYRTGHTTPEGQAAAESQDFALEQPDWLESMVAEL